MSKGSAIILLGLFSAFLPFTGFPSATETVLAVIFGLLTMVFGYLVREERLWLTRALNGGQKAEARSENSASFSGNDAPSHKV